MVRKKRASIDEARMTVSKFVQGKTLTKRQVGIFSQITKRLPRGLPKTQSARRSALAGAIIDFKERQKKKR